VLALALQLNVAVWSNDNDFEDAGVEWHTTAELLKMLAFVLRPINHGDGEGGAGQEQGVEVEPLLLGQGRKVLEDLIVGCGRCEDLLYSPVPCPGIPERC
jgi:hypothetical protein